MPFRAGNERTKVASLTGETRAAPQFSRRQLSIPPCPHVSWCSEPNVGGDRRKRETSSWCVFDPDSGPQMPRVDIGTTDGLEAVAKCVKPIGGVLSAADLLEDGGQPRAPFPDLCQGQDSHAVESRDLANRGKIDGRNWCSPDLLRDVN